MFKNKFTKDWFQAVAYRTLWTMIETMLTFITIGSTLADIDWKTMLSATVVAGLYTALSAVIRNLPEVKVPENTDKEE